MATNSTQDWVSQIAALKMEQHQLRNKMQSVYRARTTRVSNKFPWRDIIDVGKSRGRRKPIRPGWDHIILM
jgi:hypothetical protein